jgi:hypothetical protein
MFVENTIALQTKNTEPWFLESFHNGYRDATAKSQLRDLEENSLSPNTIIQLFRSN